MSVKSFLPVVGPRSAPTTTLRLLREVTPFVDLFAPNDGEWWLLRYDPDNYTRRHEGRKILARWNRTCFAPVTAQLMLAGLSLLQTYPANIDGHGDVMRDDLSQMLNRSLKQLEGDFRERANISEGLPRERNRIAVLNDYVRGQAASDHAFYLRGRVSSLTKARGLGRLVSSVRRVIASR